MARDSEALTDEVRYFDEPEESAKKLVQLRIAGYANRKGLTHAEALELMQMCGVHPRQLEEGDPELSNITMGRFV